MCKPTKSKQSLSSEQTNTLIGEYMSALREEDKPLEPTSFQLVSGKKKQRQTVKHSGVLKYIIFLSINAL